MADRKTQISVTMNNSTLDYLDTKVGKNERSKYLESLVLKEKAADERKQQQPQTKK
jgi:hypothetical protein